VNSLGPEGLASLAHQVPVGRIGRTEDIAAVFLFLASEEAAYITGQTLVVDGGLTIALV
jgi:3-oxoacyl-[acyl-carrier protein] reductase